MGCAANVSALFMFAMNVLAVLLVIASCASTDSLFTGTLSTKSHTLNTNDCGIFKCSDEDEKYQMWALNACDERENFMKATRAAWLIAAVVLAFSALAHFLQGAGCAAIAPSMRAMRFVHVVGIVLGCILMSFTAAIYAHDFPTQDNNILKFDVCKAPVNVDGTEAFGATYNLKIGFAPFFGAAIAVMETINLFLATRTFDGAGYSDIN